MHRHKDKLAYFFIAVAVCLFMRAAVGAHAAKNAGGLSAAEIVLYFSTALALLTGNVPRVFDIPMHYAYPLRCLEIFAFGVTVVCFIVLCIRHLF